MFVVLVSLLLTWNIFHTLSSISIVNLECVIAGWEQVFHSSIALHTTHYPLQTNPVLVHANYWKSVVFNSHRGLCNQQFRSWWIYKNKGRFTISRYAATFLTICSEGSWKKISGRTCVSGIILGNTFA